MSLNLNKVMIAGRLTDTPEIRTTQSGLAVTSFTVAVNRKTANAKGETEADFIPVVAWRNTAEFITRYFMKGQSIFICGRIQQRVYEDREGKKRYAYEVIADEVNFVESKKSDNGSQHIQQTLQDMAQANTNTQFQKPTEADDDLPF